MEAIDPKILKVFREYHFKEDGKTRNWFHPVRKKEFTFAALMENTPEWVFVRIHEPNYTKSWQVYKKDGSVNIALNRTTFASIS